VWYDVGASPTPHCSFQWKLGQIDARVLAAPVIATLSPVSGAYQSGEWIAACGGILPSCAICTAAPRLTRPHAKCGDQPPFAGSGMPAPRPFNCVAASAVCSRISRVSSGDSVKPARAPALITMPAAPEALPVFSEPVEPSIAIEPLPPY